MANIVIDILAEFTGKNAFKSAETSTDKLNKSAKQLGKTLGLTFSGAAVLAYAKKSIKAAAEDQAAQASLVQTLKNLGYENKAVADSVNGFISNLERQTGILDDDLRPAMDRLLRATGSVTESQKLMGLALDISAGTGKDLGQVTQSLQKAYLGQTQALGRLGVGLSKAELASSNFEEITSRLSVLFAGQAQRQADSFKGSIDKLGVAANNVSEIIGTGLIDALKILAEDSSVDELAKGMEAFATDTSNAIKGVAVLLEQLKKIPAALNIPGLKFALRATGLNFIIGLGEKQTAKEEAAIARATNGIAHLAELETKYANITLKSSKKITTEENKQLKAKQLKLAIDKANLALGKGSDVFDMEKISLAAAEKNAAEQLGKVTSQAQLLQITNDLARLEVKQSILALEEAIASQDVAAITAATNKLNADLKIVGALTGQEVKLKDIKSILDAILPKDLINLANLDDALAKLAAIGKALVAPTSTPTSTPTGTGTLAVPTVQVPSIFAQGQRPNQGGGFDFFDPDKIGMTSGGTSGGTTKVEVTVIAPPFTDPNAVAEAINDFLQNAKDRGTLVTN